MHVMMCAFLISQARAYSRGRLTDLSNDHVVLAHYDIIRLAFVRRASTDRFNFCE